MSKIIPHHNERENIEEESQNKKDLLGRNSLDGISE